MEDEVEKILDRVVIHAEYSHPGYGEPSMSGDMAIKAFSKVFHLLLLLTFQSSPPFLGLDPTYSAKAAACMLNILSEVHHLIFVCLLTEKEKDSNLFNKEVFPVFWSSKTSNHSLNKTISKSLMSLQTHYKDWIVEGCFGEPPYWSAPEPIRNLCKV